MSSIPGKSAPFILICIVLPAILTAQVIQHLTADRFTHYAYDDWISYAPALNITSIDMDDNYVYFASAQGGILRYDKYQNFWDYPFTTSNGLRSNRIRQVVYSAEDLFLYAATSAGIDLYNSAERYWHPADHSKLPPRMTPSAVELEGMDQNKNFRFPPYYRPDNSVLPNFFTDLGLTYQPGGILYDRYNRDFLFTDRIVDSWQRLWIGSNGMGPLKADLYNLHLESLPQSLPSISPRDIFLSADQVWIGGLNNGTGIAGITLWNTNDNSWRYFEAQYINTLYRDDVVAIDGDKTHIVFATIDGVAIYIPNKNKWLTLNSQAGLEGDRVNDVLVKGDVVYVASEFGFNWISLNSLKVHESAQTILDHVLINQLAYKDSLIWAATRFGLFSIDINQDIIKNQPSHAAMIDYNLTAIEAVADELWMAGQGGIAYWNQLQDEWHSFTNLDLQFTVRDIAATDNCIWFATDKGLLKYDRRRDYWRMYTEKDGLISRNTYHLDPQDEYLWITTSEGISRFRWWSKERID